MYTVTFEYFRKSDKAPKDMTLFQHITKIRYITSDEIILEGEDILNHTFELTGQIITLYSENSTYNASSENLKCIQVSKEAAV